MERRVSAALEELMEQRRTICRTRADGQRLLQPVEGVERYASCVSPIISAGDVVGSVMFLVPDVSSMATESEIKLVNAAAMFLGKQMEE